MRIADTFAGIGGFSLAAEWAGMSTAWFSEVDPYASAVLAKQFPGIPNHGDIRAIDGRQVEPVDILCGGFPCQDISNAGLRAGITGERSGLWNELARVIREAQPRWVVIENVAALLRRGYDVVRGDLRAAGYRVARPVVMSASAVGAPHRRERLWIVAHAERREWRPEPHRGAVGRVGRQQQPLSWDRDWQGALRELRGMDDGTAYRVDRVDCIRNAIVPQVALEIFRAIEAAEAVRTAA